MGGLATLAAVAVAYWAKFGRRSEWARFQGLSARAPFRLTLLRACAVALADHTSVARFGLKRIGEAEAETPKWKLNLILI